MAEQIGILLVLGGIGAIVFFVLWQQWQQAQDLDATYERIARRLHGQSVPGGFLGRPFIRFHFAGAPAMLDIHSTGGKHAKYYTQIQLTWPDARLRCEIYPEKFLHGVGKMLGMEDLQIGSAEFDRQFMITSNSAEAVRRLLSGETQVAINSLRRFLGNDDINISISRGRLLIKKRSLIRDEATLERFVRLATGLHDAASKTDTEGIEFVHAEMREATLSLNSAVCQVCGDDITLDAVFCRSCKTPHHRDCWLYYGSCSTYGCGQTNFLVERKPAQADKRQP